MTLVYCNQFDCKSYINGRCGKDKIQIDVNGECEPDKSIVDGK